MTAAAGHRESLRAEAKRRGVTVYRVRVDRAASQGRSRAQAAGHPRKGELLASQRLVQIGGPGGPLGGPVVVTGRRGRLAAHDLITDVLDLQSGELSLHDFDERWGGKTLGGKPIPSAVRWLRSAETGDFDPDAIGTP